MPVTLSIKNVPDHLADLLRKRAARNHRSIQGELLVILDEAVAGRPVFTPDELLAKVRALGIKSPAEAARFVREDRDAR